MPNTFRAYHKNHLQKVMGVAVTGYAYENHMDNGGVGLKLGFYRCQSAKIAQRQQRASTRDADGNLKYDGEVIRRAGDVYWVDCTVTGSDPGTSSDPKFPLKKLFNEHVFPRLDQLVGPGGRFQGYTVIIQGDQAGPHEEDEFVWYMRLLCVRRGWCFEPQSPQSPHLNNLDLAVFPAMSTRHSILSRKKGLRVMNKEEVWDAAMQVWNELSSSVIARGFVQVHRLAQKVVQANGANGFLHAKGDQGLHCGIKKDFHDTEDGIKRRDNRRFIADAADASTHAVRLHVRGYILRLESRASVS
jgi:hypothetical protein